jgi:hypothetical protein
VRIALYQAGSWPVLRYSPTGRVRHCATAADLGFACDLNAGERFPAPADVADDAGAP